MKNLTKRQIEIVEAAMGLISEKGIQNFTMRHVADKVGVSEPAVYRHFKSKLDILIAILDGFLSLISENVEEIEKTGCDSFEKLEMIFMERCKTFSSNPNYAKVIFSEEIYQNEPALTDKLLSIMQTHHMAFVQNVENAQKQGLIRNDIPSEHVCTVIMGTLRLLVTKWRMNQFEFDIVKKGEDHWNSLKYMLTKE